MQLIQLHEKGLKIIIQITNLIQDIDLLQNLRR